MSLADKFNFCPAGLKLRAYGGLGCYTKYHPVSRAGFQVKESSKHHIWVDTPDRELFITDQTLLSSPNHPEGFHEFTNLSHIHANSSSDLGLHLIMLNYTDHMDRYADASIRAVGSTKGSRIVVDSGGFQLSRGDYSFIDPKDEIDWLNRNADLAMVLDVPTDDPKLIKRAAIIQKHNTKLWMQEKRDSLELINIGHGVGDSFLRYHDIVYDERIDRIAMGGLFYMGLFHAMYNILFTMLNTNKHYKHHHVLGVTHRGAMIALMYMAKLGLSPHITCDSSSALQLSCYRTLYLYNRMEESLYMQDLGNKGNYSTGVARLPCNCPVCSTLVYADTFRELKGDIPDALVCMHNVHTFNHWVQHNLSFVENESKDAIKDSLTTQFKVGYGMQGVKDMHALLDFIDMAVNDGLEKARKRFDRYFYTVKPLVPSTMLSEQERLTRLEEGEAPKTAEYEWTDGVLSQYEKYHHISSKKGS